MQSTVLTNARIVTEPVIENGFVWIKGERIYKLGDMEECPSLEKSDLVINCEKGEWVIPGMIDVHIHGAGGSDVMDATPDALETMTRLLPEEGTTSFLATTLTSSKSNIEAALKNTAEYVDGKNKPGQAEIVGIHLEGPFINKEKKGAQPEEHIIEPNIDLFDEWQRLSNHLIKLVTLAPELDRDHALVRHLVKTGVIASMGHTSADYDEVQHAVQHGLSHVTHLYNAMTGVHHRDPGAAGAALIMDELMVEIIADGIHAHPEMAKLAFRSKGSGKIVLITDSMRAKCLKNGTYDLGGQAVHVEDGRAELSNGSLAGSVLKLSEGRRNMQQWTDASIGELVAMTSENPAKELGIFDRKGSIEAGKDADLVLIGSKQEVLLTMCRGEVAFQKTE
ncbi:N-acetylglucosamine-6-phosphate deacetylase [Alkalihalobacillus sp. AL-G]|uniref:N-acetylglucosamine-6-phosphate deacetylase n=1 Tax=Alkalihalobacillus sp. AL-G TaxID=2926399 RepID=UPI00272C40A2|nr:N-acetylglucosamine-6-phosphate deacetylase [Alkalihalobacillus sp. AL-G]WLD92822.1 N-acetylglucosamine-6-phosphate deacetylase [Alkalihalobacillus sp. AL-G]